MSDSLVKSLLRLSIGSLNKNQKRGLVFIKKFGSFSSFTALANQMSLELDFSLSTSWNIVRSLKNLELLSFSDGVSLSVLGEIIFEEVSYE